MWAFLGFTVSHLRHTVLKYVFLCVCINTLTYVNSVSSRLSDVSREDVDVIAVDPNDCRQLNVEDATFL